MLYIQNELHRREGGGRRTPCRTRDDGCGLVKAVVKVAETQALGEREGGKCELELELELAALERPRAASASTRT